MNDPKRIIIVLIFAVFLGLCSWGIKGHIDSDGYKKQVNYTTAVQTTKQDDFNYIVDSQQGRVLANGSFKAIGKAAKFDEMHKGYTYVDRIQEHYTMHTREVCTGSGESESCYTEVYYTWDFADEDTQTTEKLSFMGREYPANLFNFSSYKTPTSCSEFAAPGSGNWLEDYKGCVDGDFYIDDDNRYTYQTVPTDFNATFLATTYGGLKPFNENSITLQNKPIQKVLKDVGKYQLISFWTLVALLIILTIAAICIAYAWVMEDGVWSLSR